jgi:hypothetical protein
LRLTMPQGPARMYDRLRPLLVVALAGAFAGAALGACASGGAPATTESSEAPAPRQALAPLAVFRTQRLVIVPVQRLRAGDELGWGAAMAAAIGDGRAQLAALDTVLAAAARDRGAAGWTFAPDVERQAKRNPTVAPDPHALAIDELLGKRQPEQLTGPLGSQLRALVALGGQRYVLVPAELRYARRTDGRGEAVLKIVLVDSRVSRPLWSGEVRSDPADTPSRALLDGVATHLADLISPPAAAPGA